MDWKNYEKEIFDKFRNEYPKSSVTQNVFRKGKYSNVDRQIDILIEDYIAGIQISIIIDGKYFNKKIDVKQVESFIGMLEDIGAQKGLLISKNGFTQAAINRAYYGPSEIELDILNFKDLKLFQSYCAIPYAGNNGALIPAPFGWVIDGQKSPLWIATIYQQGLTLYQAMKNNEYMYINFWNRKKDNKNLSDLLEYQEETIRQKVDQNASFEYPPTIKRKDAKTILRIATINKYPNKEYTGFVEFNSFIFFCVMFSPLELCNKNIRKLENIMSKVVPLNINHAKVNKDNSKYVAD